MNLTTSGATGTKLAVILVVGLVVSIIAQGATATELSNGVINLQIDTRTGRLTGATFQGRACLEGSEDKYLLDAKQLDKPIVAYEIRDRVISQRIQTTPQDKSVILECENKTLAAYGVSITKTYRLAKGSKAFSKEVKFTNKSSSNGYWVSYHNYTQVALRLRKGGYYYSPFMKSQIWASQIKGTTTLNSNWYGPHRNESCAIINPLEGYGVGGYVYKTNGRFVSSFGNPNPPTGSEVLMTLEAEGFRIGNDVDFVSPGKSISITFQWQAFEGDVFDYLWAYFNLPEIVEMRRENKSADWMDEISVLGYGANNSGYLGEYYVNGWWREFTDLLKWGYYAAYFDHHGDHHGRDVDPNDEQDQFFQRFTKEIHADIPKMKIGMYVPWDGWAKSTDVFKKHPEYFVYDRSGKILHSAYTRYAVDISISGAYRHFLETLAATQEFMDLDFISFDGGVGPMALWGRTRNWGYEGATPTMAQWYDWYDFFGEVATRIQAKNPNMGFHCNQPTVFHAGMGMMEMPNWWGPSFNWRDRSDLLFTAKMGEAKNTCLTALNWNVYDGNGKLTPFEDYCYTKMLFMLALRPTMAFPHVPFSPDALFKAMKARVPWANAAYEMRGAKLFDADVSPWWYALPQGSQTEIETYTLQHNNDRFITVCNHGKSGPVSVTVDSKKFGLVDGKTVLVWENSILNPSNTPNTDSGVVAQNKLTVLKPPIPPRLTVLANINNEDIRVFNVTQVPGFIAEVEGHTTEFKLVDSLDIATDGYIDNEKKEVHLVVQSKKRDNYKIAVFMPRSWSDNNIVVVLDDQVVAGTGKVIGGEHFVITDIQGSGRHEIVVKQE